MNSYDLIKLANTWKEIHIGVIGDLMLDRYVWGRASRISQEAPIPVVEVREVTMRPGGAANVLHNLLALGAQTHAYGVIGKDINGDNLLALLKELGADTHAIVQDADRITTEKTRILAGSQQVVRVDTEHKQPISPEATTQLLAYLEEDLAQGRIHGLIIEDYAKGTLGPNMVTAIVHMAKTHDIPVAMDPHPANPMPIAELTLMTPNRAEAFALAGHYLSESVDPVIEDEALMKVAAQLQKSCSVKYLLITLGAGGMALFRTDAPPLHVPTVAREVFDVSGAGDTVIASFLLALVAGSSPETAAVIANHAAGVVVGKVGTAPVNLEELIAGFPDATGSGT